MKDLRVTLGSEMMIELRALGKSEIETGVTTLTPSQQIVFAAALYLVLERGKRVSRSRLALLLWPGTVERTRGHRLRQTILQLKKWGILIHADRDTVQILQDDTRSDVDALLRDGAETIATADSLEFLPGYSPRFSEPFRDWVDSKRDEINTTLTCLLLDVLNLARRKGDWLGCDRIAKQCRKLDPLNETAILIQAEATAMRGAKKEALALLDRYVNEIEGTDLDLRLPATLLRERISDSVPERTKLVAREPAFIGRDREMELLISQTNNARTGNGGGCLITGEAGIGKTRLTSEIVRFAQLGGVQAERTVCRRSDIDRPLSAFVDLVPRLRELPGALGCSQETLSVLRRLTEFDGSASDVLLTDDSTVSDAQVRRALFDLFDAIVEEQTLLIVVEDVQWLDRSSTKLLAAMVSWASSKNLFFLLNERSASNGVSGQISLLDLHILPLSPLEPSLAKTLVGAIVEEAADLVTADVVNWLLTVGEGNPFFLQELGKQWLETGKQHEFPPSISAVVDDRLSRLSRDSLQVLQTCAVLGVNATMDRVQRVLEYKSHRLLSAVQELSVAGLLHETTEVAVDISEQLHIRHDLLSTAAIRRLGRTPLALMHTRAGSVLEKETIGNGASTSLLWACAFHWRYAGDRERAFGAARACAEHLLEVGLPFDASQAFERALEYCVTDEQRLAISSRLAVALQMHGQWERSIDVLRKARQIRTLASPTASTHDDVELALFEATWRASLDNSIVLADIRGCAAREDSDVTHRAASGLLGLKIASDLSDIGAMKEIYRAMVPLLDEPRVSPATRFEIDMIFHSVCGDVDRAAQATKQFLGVARAEKHPLTFSRAVGNAAVAFRLGGRKEDSEGLFIEVLDHAIAHGLTARASFAAYSLVRLYLGAGDVRKARQMMERAERMTRPAEDVHLVADHSYLSARIALEEGNLQDASSRFAIIIAETSPNQSVNRRTAVLALGIRIAILQSVSLESLWGMVAQLEAAHLLNRGTGWQDFEADALFHGLLACGKDERAKHLLKEYATVYRREKWPLPKNLSSLLALTTKRDKSSQLGLEHSYDAREAGLRTT
jgi:DNA-binding SARP family transcriptional activator/tetratricopeptide (TPR) repeat protein